LAGPDKLFPQTAGQPNERLAHVALLVALGAGGLTRALASHGRAMDALSGLKDRDTALRQAEDVLHQATREHIHVLLPGDAHYPRLLHTIADPPGVLFCRGDPTLLNRPMLAVVGSRQASAAGLENAFAFARALVGAGLVVTSGLARGIDGAAHRGALAGGGSTIAILGSGCRRIYPPEHHTLAGQIIACGAVVSEQLPDAPPHRAHFPRRNRLISGMTLGTLVVEAGMKSGALITAHSAADQGREVFAIPGSIHNPMTKGCHHLLRQGAKLIENLDDILEELPIDISAPMHHEMMQPEGSPAHGAADLSRFLDDHGTPMDVLAARTGLSIPELATHLLALELEGAVRVLPGGLYCPKRRKMP
jgi:DNA processing protein